MKVEARKEEKEMTSAPQIRKVNEEGTTQNTEPKPFPTPIDSNTGPLPISQDEVSELGATIGKQEIEDRLV